MSKMSEIAMELDDQAAELGFESYEEALAKGYVIDYLQGKLVKQDEQESAHEAWLKEREEVLDGLDIVAHSDAVPFEHKEIVKQAIEFVRGIKSE